MDKNDLVVCIRIYIGDEVHTHFIPDLHFKIGRSDGNAIQLLLEGISREHLEVEVLDNKFFIKDLGSRFGSFVDGEKLPSDEFIDYLAGEQIVLGAPNACFTMDLVTTFNNAEYFRFLEADNKDIKGQIRNMMSRFGKKSEGDGEEPTQETIIVGKSGKSHPPKSVSRSGIREFVKAREKFGETREVFRIKDRIEELEVNFNKNKEYLGVLINDIEDSKTLQAQLEDRIRSLSRQNTDLEATNLSKMEHKKNLGLKIADLAEDIEERNVDRIQLEDQVKLLNSQLDEKQLELENTKRTLKNGLLEIENLKSSADSYSRREEEAKSNFELASNQLTEVKTELNTKEELLEQKNKELSVLVNELETKQSRYDEKLKRIVSEIETKEREYKEIAEDAEDLNEQISAGRDRLSALKIKLHEKEREEKALLLDIADSKEEVSRLENKIEEKKSEYSTSFEKNEDLLLENSKLKIDSEKLKDYISTIDEELEIKNNESVNLRRELIESGEKLASTKIDLRAVQKELNSKEDKIQDLTDQIHDNESKIQILNSDRNKLDLENESIAKKLELRKLELEELQEKSKNSSNELQELQEDLQKAKLERSKILNDIDEIREKKENLSTENESLLGEIEAARLQLIDLKEKISSDEEQSNALRVDLDKKQKKLVSIELDYKDLKEKMEQATDSYNDLLDLNHRLESSVETTRQKINKLEKDKLEFEEEIIVQKASLHDLGKDLEDTRFKIQEQKDINFEELNQLKSEHRAAIQELETKQSDLQNRKFELINNLDEEIQKAKEKINLETRELREKQDSELKKQKDIILDLEIGIESKKKSIESFSSDLVSIENKLSTTNELLTSKEALLKSLSEEIENSENYLKTIQEKEKSSNQEVVQLESNKKKLEFDISQRKTELNDILTDTSKNKEDLRFVLETKATEIEKIEIEQKEYYLESKGKIEEELQEDFQSMKEKFATEKKELKEQIAKQKHQMAQEFEYEKRRLAKERKENLESDIFALEHSLDNYFAIQKDEFKQHIDPVKSLVRKTLNFVEDAEFTKSSIDALAERPQMNYKSRYFKYSIGKIAPLALLFVAYLSYEPVMQFVQSEAKKERETATDIFVDNFQRQIASKPKYNPEKDLKYRSTYTDNVLYLEDYLETYFEEEARKQRTKDLNSFFIDELKLNESRLSAYLATEAVLVKDLFEIQQKINPRFINEGVARMKARELKDRKRILEIVKGVENLRKIKEQNKEFFTR
ncbi:MAG: FHA domain-containing protein [Bdellovibrionales bacterium]